MNQIKIRNKAVRKEQLTKLMDYVSSTNNTNTVRNKKKKIYTQEVKQHEAHDDDDNEG